MKEYLITAVVVVVVLYAIFHIPAAKSFITGAA